ncbi:hypothetical protein [Amycolatopsis sp.]|jgi:hypothetical protein|uniref:hypothetical protein n=1 Tax=Amycolatopsis sp. TaxID=37632 RepID=UPI002E0180AC|nr:hypothetical protein [Amycolatopsis sp.]
MHDLRPHHTAAETPLKQLEPADYVQDDFDICCADALTCDFGGRSLRGASSPPTMRARQKQPR